MSKWLALAEPPKKGTIARDNSTKGDKTPSKRDASTFVTFSQLSHGDISKIQKDGVSVDLLDALDCAEERAAIREFDAGMPRSLAESRAMQAHEQAILSTIENACIYSIENVSYKFLELLIAKGRIVQSNDGIFTVISNPR